MKKYYFIFMIVVNFVLLGCGGGSSAKEPSDNSGDVSSDFKYPLFFEDFDLAVSYLGTRTSQHVGLAVHDANFLRGVVGAEAILVQTAIHFPLLLVDDSDNISRAGCEEGSLDAFSYSATNEEPSTGKFSMSVFSGVGTNIIDEGEDCPNDFYDGYIEYVISDQSLSVTYGMEVAERVSPFFYCQGYTCGLFSDAGGFLGYLDIEFPDRDSKDSIILTTQSVETFSAQFVDEGEYDYMGSLLHKYKITDRLKFSDVDISSIKGERETVFNADYIREWDEYGETFILHTKIEDLVFLNEGGDIVSGSARFELTVKDKPNRYVNLDVSYFSGPDKTTVTYMKEGLTSTNF